MNLPKPNSKTPWMSEEITALLKGVAEGKTLPQIMDDIPDRTDHAIIAMAKKYKIIVRRGPHSKLGGDRDVFEPVKWPAHVRFDNIKKVECRPIYKDAPPESDKRDRQEFFSLVGNSSRDCAP